MKEPYIADLAKYEDQAITGFFAVASKQVRSKRDGSRYFYSGVPASVIDALCESDSAGKVFNQQIRGKYLAVRVP